MSVEQPWSASPTLQFEFQALSEQVKDLGEVSKAAMDSKKSSKTGGVSS